MILVIVEHFLTDDGMKFFPEWIRKTNAILLSFEGFISLEQIESIPNENRTLLLLRFTSTVHLRTWSTSSAHQQVLDELTPYRLVKQKSHIYQLERMD